MIDWSSPLAREPQSAMKSNNRGNGTGAGSLSFLKGRSIPGKVLLTRRSEHLEGPNWQDWSPKYERSLSENEIGPSSRMDKSVEVARVAMGWNPTLYAPHGLEITPDRREGDLRRKRLEYLDCVAQFYEIPDTERSNEEIACFTRLPWIAQH